MNDTDDDSSTQGDEDSNNTRTLYSDDEMVADQHYSSDTSTCSEIKRPPVKDSYKWCVCHKGNKTIDNRTKMCKLCSQWYHVTCLGYSKSKIDSICNKIDGKELTCPVCENDKAMKVLYTKHSELTLEGIWADADILSLPLDLCLHLWLTLQLSSITLPPSKRYAQKCRVGYIRYS